MVKLASYQIQNFALSNVGGRKGDVATFALQWYPPATGRDKTADAEARSRADNADWVFGNRMTTSDLNKIWGIELWNRQSNGRKVVEDAQFLKAQLLARSAVENAYG
jgi:hypothetical protein